MQATVIDNSRDTKTTEFLNIPTNLSVKHIEWVFGTYLLVIMGSIAMIQNRVRLLLAVSSHDHF